MHQSHWLHVPSVSAHLSMGEISRPGLTASSSAQAPLWARLLDTSYTAWEDMKM